MKHYPVRSSSIIRFSKLRSFLCSAILATAALFGCIVGSARGESVSIPNYSFEGPSTGFVSSFIDSWQKTAQPMWYSPAAFGGYSWDQLTGVFLNSAPLIDNLDGNQAALMFGLPEMGLYQELSSTYEVGKSYHLTLGLVGQGGGMLEGVTLDLQLYYRTSPTTTVVIGDQTVTHNAANFPDHTHVYDFTLDIPTVQASDPWAGQPIGIELLSTANFGNLGGYWDMDNVRLVATPAPEPASATLLAFGGLALLARRRRRA